MIGLPWGSCLACCQRVYLTTLAPTLTFLSACLRVPKVLPGIQYKVVPAKHLKCWSRNIAAMQVFVGLIATLTADLKSRIYKHTFQYHYLCALGASKTSKEELPYYVKLLDSREMIFALIHMVYATIK